MVNNSINISKTNNVNQTYFTELKTTTKQKNPRDMTLEIQVLA